MTTSLTIRSSLAVFAAALVLVLSFLWTGQAQAQSEVTGTLTAGAAATGSTATGTITGGTGSTISGTVVGGATECSDGIDNDGDGEIDMQDPACDLPTQDDESDDPGGAGNSSHRNSNNNNNNDDDDDGEVLGTETSTGVGGSGDVLGVGAPNTGAGGAQSATLALLIGSLAAMLGGASVLRRYRVS